MYKDKEKQKEAVKEAVKRHRVLQEGITDPGITDPGITDPGITGVETVPASYIDGNKGKYEFMPGRPRYLTLSDGQVLDRASQPVACKPLYGVMAANDSYMSIIRQASGLMDSLVDPVKRDKLTKVCDSLAKFKQLDTVHYGTGSYMPMSRVKELIETTAG